MAAAAADSWPFGSTRIDPADPAASWLLGRWDPPPELRPTGWRSEFRGRGIRGMPVAFGVEMHPLRWSETAWVLASLETTVGFAERPDSTADPGPEAASGGGDLATGGAGAVAGGEEWDVGVGICRCWYQTLWLGLLDFV
eukprot:m.288362 g.288362  ORF g.288362 m.288362 type:complete len:140 (+) comp27092_c1_seq1:126-545(+)